MDTVCTAATNNILAPGEQLPATVHTNDALIGHSPQYQQQLHQLLGKCLSSSTVMEAIHQSHTNTYSAHARRHRRRM